MKPIIATAIMLLSVRSAPTEASPVVDRTKLSPEQALLGHWVCTEFKGMVRNEDILDADHWYFSASVMTSKAIFSSKTRGDRGAPKTAVSSHKYRIVASGDDWLQLKIQHMGLLKIVFSADRCSFIREDLGAESEKGFTYVDNEEAPER